MTDSELISEIDCESLLIGLSKGISLNENDITSIINFIQYSQKLPKHKNSFEDLFAVLTVLCKNNDPSLSYIVIQFLNFQDCIIVSLALETLICKWQCYTELHERVTQFALGVPWDYDQDLRICALSCILHILSSKTPIADSSYSDLYASLAKEILKDPTTDEYAVELCSQIINNKN